VPMKKFLVSARNDHGGVSISEDRLQAILKEYSFDGSMKGFPGLFTLWSVQTLPG